MHYAQCKKFSKPKSRTLTERTQCQDRSSSSKTEILFGVASINSARPKTPNFLIASILLFISMGFFKKIRVDGGVFRWIKAVYCTVFSHCAGRFGEYA